MNDASDDDARGADPARVDYRVAVDEEFAQRVDLALEFALDPQRILEAQSAGEARLLAEGGRDERRRLVFSRSWPSGRASLVRHDEDAVPILGRRIVDIEFAAEVVDLAWTIVLIDLEGLAEVLESLRESA